MRPQSQLVHAVTKYVEPVQSATRFHDFIPNFKTGFTTSLGSYQTFIAVHIKDQHISLHI